MRPNPKHPAAGTAVIYIRLSGQPYGYDPFSPENQRTICQEHALRENVRILAEYQDLGTSGRKDEAGRPGLEAALDLVRRQAAEILYVAKLDRFSRRGLHHVGALLDEVDRAGGRVIFVADGLDTRHPAARKAIATLAEQARAEADAATWRLSQWHAHNRRNGRWKRSGHTATWYVTASSTHIHSRRRSCGAWSRASSPEPACVASPCTSMPRA